MAKPTFNLGDPKLYVGGPCAKAREMMVVGQTDVNYDAIEVAISCSTPSLTTLSGALQNGDYDLRCSNQANLVSCFSPSIAGVRLLACLSYSSFKFDVNGFGKDCEVLGSSPPEDFYVVAVFPSAAAPMSYYDDVLSLNGMSLGQGDRANSSLVGTVAGTAQYCEGTYNEGQSGSSRSGDFFEWEAPPA
jgi:hypothetical protein